MTINKCSLIFFYKSTRVQNSYWKLYEELHFLDYVEKLIKQYLEEQLNT